MGKHLPSVTSKAWLWACSHPSLPGRVSQAAVLRWLKPIHVSAATFLSPPLLGHKYSSDLAVWGAKLPKSSLVVISFWPLLVLDLTSRGSKDHEDQHTRAGDHSTSLPQRRCSGTARSHPAFGEAPLDPECSSQDRANRHFFPAASPHFFNHKQRSKLLAKKQGNW